MGLPGEGRRVRVTKVDDPVRVPEPVEEPVRECRIPGAPGDSTSAMSLTTETPTFITAREAGQLLRVAPRTIRRWSEQGRLTSYRLGPRSMRFDAEEITTLIADSAEAPTPSRDVTRREYVPTYPSSNTPRPFRSSQVHVGSGRK